jgi:hypothetical protein
VAHWFSDDEIRGLQPELVEKLDHARGFAAVPFIITSGLRTDGYNHEIGGVPDGAHETGEAVDLACSSSRVRHKMLPALYLAGFRRIGIYDLHLHADVAARLPQDVTWWGKSKRRAE